MYCSNGSSSMATLLQQKNVMKKLSNGRNVVVAIDDSNSQNNPNLTVINNSVVTVPPTSRLLLPHEIGGMITPPATSNNAIASAAGSGGIHNTFNNQYQYHHNLNHNQILQQSHNHNIYNNVNNHNNYQQSNSFNNHTYDVHNNYRPNSQPPPLAPLHDATPNETNTNSLVVDNNIITETEDEPMPQQQPQDDADAEPEPEIDIVINNVVCSFSVRCHLNLRDIALRGVNVEFRRENGMVTMKLRRPYTTASIWSSGRITCTGATSEDQAKIAARRYARCLQNLGFRARFQNFRVVNVLGTCSMPWAIKIVNFSEKYKKEASYEPELHPGVTYKIKNPKATLKIFSTGSITVTANSVANVQAAIEHIFPLVYEFRKKRIKVEHPIQENVAPKVKEVFSNKKRRPPGKADNDPSEDNMYVSDVEIVGVSDDEN